MEFVVVCLCILEILVNLNIAALVVEKKKIEEFVIMKQEVVIVRTPLEEKSANIHVHMGVHQFFDV